MILQPVEHVFFFVCKHLYELNVKSGTINKMIRIKTESLQSFEHMTNGKFQKFTCIEF